MSDLKTVTSSEAVRILNQDREEERRLHKVHDHIEEDSLNEEQSTVPFPVLSTERQNIESQPTETLMITATEARELYQEPPFTLGEIEQRIRERAKEASYTCVPKGRVSTGVHEALLDAGFDVRDAGTDYAINW